MGSDQDTTRENEELRLLKDMMDAVTTSWPVKLKAIEARMKKAEAERDAAVAALREIAEGVDDRAGHRDMARDFLQPDWERDGWATHKEQ